MHDIILAKEILDEVLKQAKKNKFKRISKVVVSLGKFVEHDEEISPKNLKYNFQLLAKNTLANNAKLLVKKIDQPKIWRLEEIEGV
ncbi:MAG: hydrogenase/urease maturation nickel metallochaperone HypA [Patescibacteria group bacterium]